MRTLAQRIAMLRAQSGLSLQEVANLAGCTKTHVWEIEKGRATNPTLRVLLGLSASFDVTVAYLIGEAST